MELIAKIRQAGFMVALDGEKIRFEYAGQGEPPDTAKALLDALREHKVEAIAHLKEAMPRPLFGSDEILKSLFGAIAVITGGMAGRASRIPSRR